MMTHCIRVHAVGGPDVLRWETAEVGEPGPGEVRLRHTFAGLNFIDVYHRTGLYPMPLPFTPGVEAAGVVTAVGPGVRDLRAGDRVAYAGLPGAYCEERLAPAERLVPLRAGIDDQTAAAVMLKGMTAQYLLKQTLEVHPGDVIVFHAAAGGVGLLACQWAQHLGATVIGTVGSDEKAALARAHGCAHVVVYTRESVVDRVRELTGGAGVRAVYDSVGKDTFAASLECLRPRGMMVSFGQSSGRVPPFDLATLGARSLYLTRPSLFAYTATTEDLRRTAADLLDVIARGVVRVPPPRVVPLREAAAAHAALEGRRTTGSTVLAV